MLSAQLAHCSSRPNPKALVAALRALHPGFIGENDKIIPNISLHRFSTDKRYADLHRRLGGPTVPLEPTAVERVKHQRQLALQPMSTAKTAPPLRLVLAQRNTTALFGAGQIDQVPDSVLHLMAASQAKQGEVSGRVPPVGADKVGRFGWRGQIERLHDFVLGACANELGLEVPDNPQPNDPLRPDYRPVGLDLTPAQCASLTAYVASLPAPEVVIPEEVEQRELVRHGRLVFRSVGCENCHVQRIGPLEDIFSDLLLHDLGPALADPVVAEPSLVFVKKHPPADGLLVDDLALISSERKRPPQPRPQRRGYNGGSGSQSFASVGEPAGPVFIVDPQTGERNEFREEPSNVAQEWRTPPLWGLKGSAPYLHDGRAATVVEAIALHGGEAEACARRYFALSPGDRLAMLAFLDCLRAPEPAP
jgi:hypothetical protein